jgi:hypothetical protein
LEGCFAEMPVVRLLSAVSHALLIFITYLLDLIHLVLILTHRRCIGLAGMKFYFKFSMVSHLLWCTAFNLELGLWHEFFLKKTSCVHSSNDKSVITIYKLSNC